MSDTKPLTEKNEIELMGNGIQTLTILRGEAVPEYKLKGIGISDASIDAVQEYLKKEGIEPEQIKNSVVLFSYEGLYLKLNYAIRRDHSNDDIAGCLKLHPELQKWNINKSSPIDHQTLSRFIKMNRHYFENSETAMKLVSELQNIRIKTEKEYESADDRRGNAKELIAQKLVESNIPDNFILKLPIFVGTDPVAVRVEIEINPRDFTCELISPDLKQIIDQETKVIIDEQLTAIRDLYPELRIFQK